MHGVCSFSDAAAATLGLAQHLSELGENVTLIWVPAIEVANDFDGEQMQEITDSFIDDYLINLIILTDSPALSPHLHNPEKASLAVYHILKTNQFNEVFCTLEGGLAYYSVLASELDLAGDCAPLTLLAHTPHEWSAVAEKTLFNDVAQLAVIHMERYCVEYAATVVFSSQHVKDWVKKMGWREPRRSKVVLPLLPYELCVGLSEFVPAARRDSPIEIGFWPGWEFQNGLVLFCDALDKIAQSGRTNLTINFFGPLFQILGENTGGLMLRRARNWPFALRYFPRFSEQQSLAYLKQRDGIAVFPNLMASGGRFLQATIESNLNVVATNVGSHRELVDHKGIDQLCDASATGLAEAITKAISKPKNRLKAAQTQRSIQESWRQFREEQLHTNANLLERRPRKNSADKKLVSVVIAHYERPNFLADAIKSVEQQDYTNIEVILVDDGSKKPDSIAFLKSLEPNFKKRGWKIIRQANKYLGAARNAGIKASKGSYVLFLDDDNALLPSAVTTFVIALEASGADICTSVAKIFLGPHLPRNSEDGLIEYFPLGGSLDCAFVYNSFGDANAIIRKEVFEKVGYLLEDYGFIASDWEFFTRAALHDLKIRIIPDATYWYRSSAEGMYRSSHWVESRLPILRLFERYKYKGLSHIYQLLISQNTGDAERHGYQFRLKFDHSNARYKSLCDFVPDSDEALAFLASIATAEGRSDTALNLLGQMRAQNFAELSKSILLAPSAEQTALKEEPLAPAHVEIFDVESLKGFSIASSDIGADAPLSFVEVPGQIIVQSEPDAMIVATLIAALPVGSIGLSFEAVLMDELSSPIEILAGLVKSVQTTDAASPDGSLQGGQDILASSDWVELNHDFHSRKISRKITLNLENPCQVPVTLAICVRHSTTTTPPHQTLVGFRKMSRTRFVGLGQPRRPRMGPPPTRNFARALTTEELGSAILGTAYDGKENYLEFPEFEKGFLLKPSRDGVVVAVLAWTFPAFAKGVVASVEIAHEDASPFEFAISLARPSVLGEWNFNGPLSSEAFSGWKRVERKFELHEVALELAEARRYDLTICAAIRLPEGSVVEPAESYFRKIVLTW